MKIKKKKFRDQDYVFTDNIYLVLPEICSKFEPVSPNKWHRASLHNGLKKLIQTAPKDEINWSIFLHDQDQKVHTIQQSDPTHFDQKEKNSQKYTRESTFLRSKVHLANNGSYVWPVTFFKYRKV